LAFKFGLFPGTFGKQEENKAFIERRAMNAQEVEIRVSDAQFALDQLEKLIKVPHSINE